MANTEMIKNMIRTEKEVIKSIENLHGKLTIILKNIKSNDQKKFSYF